MFESLLRLSRRQILLTKHTAENIVLEVWVVYPSHPFPPTCWLSSVTWRDCKGITIYISWRVGSKSEILGSSVWCLFCRSLSWQERWHTQTGVTEELFIKGWLPAVSRDTRNQQGWCMVPFPLHPLPAHLTCTHGRGWGSWWAGGSWWEVLVFNI